MQEPVENKSSKVETIEYEFWKIKNDFYHHCNICKKMPSESEINELREKLLELQKKDFSFDTELDEECEDILLYELELKINAFIESLEFTRKIIKYAIK